MADEPEMDAPVTRRELREELANLPTREELAKYPTRDDLRQELANYPTRKELHEALDIWGTELERRITANVTANVTASVTANVTANVTASLSASLSAEMARQFQAYDERMRDYTRALLEPHDGVPERVTKIEQELVPRVERLEAKVFAPKRSSRPTKRRAAKRR